MSAQQIYENFVNSEGPARLMAASDHLEQIEREYTQRVQQITDLAASMEEGWTGDSAGAAQRGAGPLAVAHDGASQEMATGKDLLRNQTDSFFQVKNTVGPVPSPPEEPSTFEKIITLGSAGSDYEKALNKTRAAEQRNIQAMEEWTTASGYNGSMMPSEYPKVDPNALNISQAEPAKPGGVDYPGGGVKRPGGRSGGPGGSVNPPGGSVPGGGTGGQIPGGQTPGGQTAGSPKPGDGTTPGGWTPPGAPVKPGGPVKPGQGVPGGQGDSSESGFLPGLGLGGGGTPGPGSGSGGGRVTGAGPGSGAGSAGERLTGGRGSGAGPVGGPGEPGARGGAGGAKGAGRPGGMGAGGIGQGAKGEGGEDEEHQRKFVFDDDEHFQLTDDGERVVDPRTGMAPVTPVIGE
ncbi:hypothetical protein AB5J62_06455 [Amycolatopsis sp. cg5]|uniref:hypothetical protein n=1 Tax=Amycolatopsis sp. cg5 TaxID=3238802 RepID=UPI00352322DE